MTGGTKPQPHAKDTYQDGAKKGGGVNATKPAGPERDSTTKPHPVRIRGGAASHDAPAKR